MGQHLSCLILRELSSAERGSLLHDTGEDKGAQCTFASLSAARCADELWCRARLSTFFACGREEREFARLGRAMSCSCARELVELAEEREEVEFFVDMAAKGCIVL